MDSVDYFSCSVLFTYRFRSFGYLITHPNYPLALSRLSLTQLKLLLDFLHNLFPICHRPTARISTG